jgi:hypothetical protein
MLHKKPPLAGGFFIFAYLISPQKNPVFSYTLAQYNFIHRINTKKFTTFFRNAATNMLTAGGGVR